MYKAKRFRVRGKKEVFEDLQAACEAYGDNIRRIFLADGDALVVKTEDLLEILEFIRKLFPSVERITAYGAPKDVLRKSEDELKALAASGLAMVYMGAESGDAAVLEAVKKGVSRDDIVSAGRKLKLCGIRSSITLISGLGGRARKREHAIESARLISEINPDYVGFLTLMLDESTEIYKKISSGEMELLSPDEIAQEIRLFLENVDSPGTVFRANHASNYVILRGTLNEDIPRMLAELDETSEAKKYRPERFRGL